MRLIDADNIISVCEILSEKGNDPHYWGQLISIIKDVPTIDAIPVKWIKALTNHNDMFTRGAAKWVLGCWKKEQEAR